MNVAILDLGGIERPKRGEGKEMIYEVKNHCEFLIL